MELMEQSYPKQRGKESYAALGRFFGERILPKLFWI